MSLNYVSLETRKKNSSFPLKLGLGSVLVKVRDFPTCSRPFSLVGYQGPSDFPRFPVVASASLDRSASFPEQSELLPATFPPSIICLDFYRIGF